MAISEELGERSTVELPAGRLEYRERGSGPPLVFVHGAAVNGDLWRRVAPALAAEHRCIVPDLPLGGHALPLDGEPDLSLFGLAEILASFIEALGPERGDGGGQRHRGSDLAGARRPAAPSGSAGSCSPPATRSRTTRRRRWPT